ncbi:uncharacterized protein C8Q71DRAFT_7950 [Rhodofomes roseus]|uniref:Cyclin N-terminal domain-containing protein n=1 Tax=Rhodofomes roseus TaxID=34475 RepID=A0ABQ8KWH0_9APHY|nr:uncharacterized protein C8Q71DRAFT_7950 [Rhodofomes roseus]KAH9843633.1 hypothetical protein C8Q71DRAFT_7950 [Rhodofomes roseus]
MPGYGSADQPGFSPAGATGQQPQGQAAANANSSATSSSGPATASSSSLAERRFSVLQIFISNLLHRTKLHESIAFGALLLIHRLRSKFTDKARALGLNAVPYWMATAHYIYLTAFLVASKILCDKWYNSSSLVRAVNPTRREWLTVGNLLRAEVEFCTMMDWSLYIDPGQLATFTQRVKADYSGARPYPLYSPSMSECRIPSPATGVDLPYGANSLRGSVASGPPSTGMPTS